MCVRGEGGGEVGGEGGGGEGNLRLPSVESFTN